MTTLALTGSTGFLGRALAEMALVRGGRVVAIVRPGSHVDTLPQSERLQVIETKRYDSAETTARLREFAPDSFVHLGWGGVTAGARDDHDAQQANIASTVSTVDLAAGAGCAFWLGIGSQAEYGASHAPSESAPLMPSSEYARAKVQACDQAMKKAASLGITAGWARVYSVYGPGDHPHAVLPYVIDALIANIDPVVGPCTQDWDYLHVDDAAAALIAVVQQQLGGCTNIASGQARPLRESLEIAERAVGCAARIRFDASRPASTPLVANIDRLIASTGWAPEVPIERGVEALVEAHRRAKQSALTGASS